ncbi:MAG: type II secretion system protein [Deltaproteobacteria bacterium]|nr:type II secretion system protein [Deltaproteobacteria bacterium]
MNKKKGQKGFTLLEIIMAMTIISLAVAPISMGLGTSLQIGKGGDTAAKSSYLAQAKMEEYLAKDFDAMADANGTVILGENQVWRVNVSLFDGDGDSNPDPDLKHIYVKAGDQELETLRFRMP